MPQASRRQIATVDLAIVSLDEQGLAATLKALADQPRIPMLYIVNPGHVSSAALGRIVALDADSARRADGAVVIDWRALDGDPSPCPNAVTIEREPADALTLSCALAGLLFDGLAAATDSTAEGLVAGFSTITTVVLPGGRTGTRSLADPGGANEVHTLDVSIPCDAGGSMCLVPNDDWYG